MSEEMNEIDKAKAVLARIDPEQWPNLVIALDDFVKKSASPHPEAREEGVRKALTTREVKEAIGRFRGVAHFFDIGDMSAESDGNILADAIGDALEALSRLAAQKGEGQGWRETRFVLPKERGKYLCLFAGRKQEVLYWDNEDWYDTAGIRSPKYWMPLPAAPEPRPAGEPI